MTLPDIFGNIAYPGTKVGMHYKKWYDESVLPKSAIRPEEGFITVDGEVCYKLRCAYLHSGNFELGKLDEQESKYSAELESALQQYRELESQAAEFDAEELLDARLELRPGMDHSTVSRIQTAYDTQYSPFTMAGVKRDISKMLSEDDEPRSVRERLRNQQQEQTVPRKKDRDR